VIDGPMNGTIFLAYVEQCLAPTLHRRDVVVTDNLPARKVAGVADAIEAVGARAFYLPPYSPDLNPIEQVFRWRADSFAHLIRHSFAHFIRQRLRFA
jgi:transposase